MSDYRFTTLWYIEAPREAVCAAIEHSLDWPRWWPGAMAVVELAAGNADGIGNIRRYTWKGRLPYRLCFDIRVTQMSPQTMVEGVASGDVEGIGRWSFASEGRVTIVRYDWHIRAKASWMRVLTPLARPLFRWNHNIVMRQGGRQLARLLGGRLLNSAHL